MILRYVSGGLHDGIEVVHIAVVFRVICVLAGWVELVDLGLEARVCRGVCEEQKEEACESARRGVCASNYD